MRIAVFNGSHRGERGVTHWMAREFLAGAAEGGAEVENVILANHRILPCRACYCCWTTKEGCPQRDDMPELLHKLLAADLVVFATPVYVDNVSGIMKVFMDRLIATGDPHIEKDPSGECRHAVNRAKTPKMGVIAACGFPEQSHFQVLELLFKRMARNFHAELVAEIYRGAGGLLLSEAPELQPFIERYRQALRDAGLEVAKEGCLSSTSKTVLDAPLLPDPVFLDRFITRANEMWESRIARSQS